MGNCGLYIVRISQLLLTCVTFSLAIHGAELSTARGVFLTSWFLSFFGTLVVLVMMTYFDIKGWAPNFWTNFQETVAGFAFLLCLSATAGFPIFYLGGSQQGKVLHYRISSLVFSFLVTMGYVCEMVCLRKTESETKNYLSTILGKFKLSEVFVACFIFMLISDPTSYNQYPLLQGCVGVYSFCFISSVVVTLTNVLGYPCWCSCLEKFYSVLAVLMYLTATVIWPLFQFNSSYSNQTHRPPSCCEPGSCLWDSKAGVAVLTAINLLIYLGDAIITVHDRKMTIRD